MGLISLSLSAAGLLAGALNAVAGGGTIFSFSALLAVGVPPVMANATSATAVVLGTIASACASRRELVLVYRQTIPLCVISAVGAAVGTALLLMSGDRLFGRLVPWLIVLATGLFAAGPPMLRGSKIPGRGLKRHGVKRLALLLQGIVAVYGEYFGAGMGVMMLATLGLGFRAGYQETNAVKNLLSIVIQSVPVAVFLALGLVEARQALAIAASSMLGWVAWSFRNKAHSGAVYPVFRDPDRSRARSLDIPEIGGGAGGSRIQRSARHPPPSGHGYRSGGLPPIDHQQARQMAPRSPRQGWSGSRAQGWWKPE